MASARPASGWQFLVQNGSQSGSTSHLIVSSGQSYKEGHLPNLCNIGVGTLSSCSGQALGMHTSAAGTQERALERRLQHPASECCCAGLQPTRPRDALMTFHLRSGVSDQAFLEAVRAAAADFREPSVICLAFTSGYRGLSWASATCQSGACHVVPHPD